MRIRAVCPGCGQRIGRMQFLSIGRKRCAKCRATIKPNPTWDGLGSTPFAVVIALCIGLAAFGWMSWWLAILAAIATFVSGVIAFPYITPYILLAQGQMCRKCGYDLYGTSGRHCPECGAEREASFSHAETPRR